MELLELPFVQRGIAEILLLSIAAGLIGTWVVLRGLAFYSHAAGTAAFPGLVLASGLGFAAPLGALGASALFALGIAGASGRRGDDRGAEIALALVGMLALGVILASDVFESSAQIGSLLFGSLFLIDAGDLALAGGVALLALGATAVAGQRWLAAGFAGAGDAATGEGARDLGLLALVGVATAAAITVVGALLVAALFVVPAATTRLFIRRLRSWQVASVALCAAEGVAGVLVSVELNAPPGATIATISGAVFALAALVRITGARRAVTAAATAALLVGAGCGPGSSGGVVATTPVAGDLARAVAGPDLSVTTIVGQNSDPHDFEPRSDDIAALAGAEIVVASGGELDAWIEGAMDDAGSDAELVTLNESLPHAIAGDDPHWWHDPRNTAAAVRRLGAALGDLAPAAEARAGDYADQVAAADRAIAACIDRVRAGERKLVTDHDAFGYLAARYELEIVDTVLPATTTEAQASAGELAELRDTIEREGVRAVFPEAAIDRDLAATIAGETGASSDHELYGDSLGPEGTPAATYLGMIHANADELVRGLTGGERGCP